MNNSEIILQCHSVHQIFKDGDTEIPVLNGIDFQIEHGESVAIMGASGAGKSTLLQLLGGLDNPTSGSVILKGNDFSKQNSKKRGLLRNQYLGFVYQFHHLLPEFSALENVMMPLLIAKESKKSASIKAEQLLTKVGLKDRLTHRPAQLSGGERQRAAIARALVTNPACLLADEPTGNLDESTASEVMELMLELNKQQNNGMIIVTHDKHLASKMNKIYELSGGHLVRQ
ncbi:MAG TPA: lipoprotein-releasing ABC transporter ATP-binding protein LolD [Gammaproteobacteria bacterium]|nr:lipoprotein-releasing ABC transporter ATP-binding protein LolD [Xanthomonadales bacterium]MCB1594386.1 lipoprotein-releasing ABC transporter ATP-binding protein LolD [Xanthomonadales bacterium]HOP22239.1 lipoprotein-releasing ABC transporter ATP-binding protein LolD [Gammaproteobacteria bacterium]HPI95289.1 lipoprotein-releasing ABC transporter ATP-binding protein LolD [Gammaproteobacteria bacterium]HPQ87263.1 lipoprotein-releasing ABC transporter ATP-binding protein LolD [Gammaproteobacteri